MLSGLVLIAGLGFGRELVQWWRSETATPSTVESPLLLSDSLGDLSQTHTLQFGDLPWRFRRQQLAGSKEEAVTKLREMCREAVPNEIVADLPGPAEKRLLDRFRRQKPVEEMPGQWQLYALVGEFPMVAVIRGQTNGAGQGSGAVQPEGTTLGKPEDGPASQAPHVASKGRRVVTWGLAIPTGKETWNLYTFAATGKAQESAPSLPELSLPPNSRRILSLQAAGGGAVVSIQGRGRPEDWQHFFDDWFQQRGWTGKASWGSSDSAWYRRYTSKSGQPKGTAEVYLRRNSEGMLTGVLTALEIEAPAERRYVVPTLADRRSTDH